LLLAVGVTLFLVLLPASARTTDLGGDAAPLAAPNVDIGLNLPGSVMLGEDFSFTVSFDNTGDTGYGPFIDLVFPVNGADGRDGTDPNPPRDGIDFVKASFLGQDFSAAQGTLSVQSFPDHSSGVGCVEHPWVRDISGDLVDVCGPSGDKLVSLRLPFGSFTSEQPAAVVNVDATFLVDTFRDYADVGTGLVIKVRGGFMFGANPLDDWCCGDLPIVQPSDTDSSSWPDGTVTPQIMTVAKAYNGPSNLQDETATGPNFPRTYTLTVDIAEDQTINNLVVVDVLPENVQYLGVSSSIPYDAISEPLTSTPGGTLSLTYDTVTNTDVTITVSFYVPRLDSTSNAVIDAGTGDDATSVNTVSAEGDWTPNDPRDLPAIHVVAAGVPGSHTLQDKSIAIQKSVENLTNPVPDPVTGLYDNSPDDTLKYTISFQVSDFFAFGGDMDGTQTPADSDDDLGIVVSDLLSDGQRVVPGSLTFTLSGNPTNISEIGFSIDNYDILCNYTDGPGSECTGTASSIPAGTTQLVFRVSDEIIDQVGDADGRMVGGCVDPVLGSAIPDCSTYNNGPTTATITFEAIIQDKFTDDHLLNSGDASVDQGDVLDNTVDILGYVLDSSTFAVGEPETDDAAASVTIKSLGLTKDIYALNGSTDYSAYVDPATGKLEIKPGDLLTYRLTYELFTSDVEELLLQDYLPLPVFNVTDPDDDGASENWSFVYNDFTAAPGYFPPAGVVSNGPSDTFYTYMQEGLADSGSWDSDGAITGDLTANSGNSGPTIEPEVDANAANNRVDIAYANYDDTRQESTTVDLLLSVVVTADPFADRLFLTNQAYAEEGSTNSFGSESNDIIQVILTQPVLRSTKTVVWTSNPSNVFSVTQPVTFNGPANEPRWTGTITPANVGQLDSDVSGLDAGDIVTFAIVIQNTGSSLKGAFDITIQDTLPAEFETPSGTYPLNLQIYFGSGQGFDYGSGLEELRFTGLGSGTETDLFGAGIRLDDDDVNQQGICQAHDPLLNEDIIVITYDLFIKQSVAPGEITNTSSIINYAGEEGGPNHLPEPLDDDATVDVNAAPTKSLVATSESHTTGTNVTIGEIVRYQMSVRLPESTMTDLVFHDQLPNGLIFLNDGTATVWFDTSIIAGPPDRANVITSDFGSVPAIPDTCISTAPCDLQDWNISTSLNSETNSDAYGSGTDVYFRLGVIENLDRDTDEEYAFIEFNALVHNQNGSNAHRNDAGDGRSNNVRVLVGGTQSGDTSNNVTVRVREPGVTLTKTHSAISTIQAGDVITYTITLANTASNTVIAFDIEFEDPIPATYLTLNPASVAASADFAPLVAVNNNPSGTGNLVDISIAAIPAGGMVTIEYEVTATVDVMPSQAIDNTADVTWTSLPGEKGTNPNPTGSDNSVVLGNSGDGTGERNGDPVTTVNDYRNEDTATLNVTDPFYSKSLTDSSAAHTTIPAHAVGEIATFGLFVTVPQGTTPGVTIVDDLPDGLAYVADSAELITNNGQSASCPLSQNFAGTFSDALGVSAAGGSGGDVTFTLGQITVDSDGDDTNNTFLICFQALVVNETGVDNGDTLTNSTDFTINGVTDTQTADVEVLEPILEITKTVTDETPADGQTITFTITLTHDASSTADAFDIEIEDLLPPELTLVGGTLAITPSSGINPAWITDNSSGSTIAYAIEQIPLGEQVEITFDAVVGTLSLTDSFDNTATAIWTSLPGDDSGERTGDGGVNDHQDASTQAIDILRDLTKTISSDNLAATITPEVTIGELITYEITIVVPPDSTDQFYLTDQLDDGLAFVDCETITAGASLSSSTIAFNTAGNCAHGLTGNPAISNSGRTLEFNLGTVTNSNPTGYETIVIRYRVVVLDSVANFDGNGLTYSNEVELTWSTGSLTDDTPGLSIVESHFSLEKSVQNEVVKPGNPVIFYLEVTPTLESHTTGYDLEVIDVIPLELDIPSGGIIVTTVSGQAPDSYSFDPTTRTLSIIWDELEVISSSLVSFEVIMGDVRPGEEVLNIANLVWSSMPGIPTAAPGQPEGVQSPYDEASTERTYDPGSPADLTYFATSEIAVRTPVLPGTGFAPGVVTEIGQKPKDLSFQQTGGIQLEIPTLGLIEPVVGVPMTKNGWDVTWLASQIGYLEGTAYPTWAGNTALTAHVYTADGLPGPFVDLDKLTWGQEVILHANGMRYVYQVRSVRQVAPTDLSVLDHQDLDYLTLITCRSFDALIDGYRWRTVVQAVLVSVTAE
jgi:LPXTG-site transpeptidase (sortase) family protein